MQLSRLSKVLGSKGLCAHFILTLRINLGLVSVSFWLLYLQELFSSGNKFCKRAKDGSMLKISLQTLIYLSWAEKNQSNDSSTSFHQSTPLRNFVATFKPTIGCCVLCVSHRCRLHAWNAVAYRRRRRSWRCLKDLRLAASTSSCRNPRQSRSWWTTSSRCGRTCGPSSPWNGNINF